MNKKWTNESKKTITKLKLVMGKLTASVRSDQYLLFEKHVDIKPSTTVLDVGVSSEEDIEGTNQFEKNYPYPGRLTLATIENYKKLKRMYPYSKVKGILPKRKLPFKKSEFDVVVSWATLEHVGDYSDQLNYINELLRVGKSVFITTPYRGCIYEPHSGLFFLHWLPLPIFRRVCIFLGKRFWSSKDNLNPLYVRDLTRMKFIKKVNFKIYNLFKVLPSHIIITSDNI